MKRVVLGTALLMFVVGLGGAVWIIWTFVNQILTGWGH